MRKILKFQECRAYKRRLFEAAKTWKGQPLEAHLKSLIMLDDENDD